MTFTGALSLGESDAEIIAGPGVRFGEGGEDLYRLRLPPR